MRVCFIVAEFFAFGVHGGFGRATRTIAREFVARGIEAFAIVPRRAQQRAVEALDGVTVLSCPRRQPWQAGELARRANADIYHSSEPSAATWFAMRAMPERKHVITCRDPRDLKDWALEFRDPVHSRLRTVPAFLNYRHPLVKRAVQRAAAVFSPAETLIPKIQRLYGLAAPPHFLPTPPRCRQGRPRRRIPPSATPRAETGGRSPSGSWRSPRRFPRSASSL